MAATVKKLKKFEGREVVGTAIKVTNAGDGLSANMAIEPQEMQLDEGHIVILRTTVSKVEYTEIKDTSSLIRTHSLKAGTAIIASDELVALVEAHLAAQEEKIAEAKRLSKLDFAGDDGDDGTEGGEQA